MTATPPQQAEPVSRRLAEVLAATRYADLPPEVVNDTKRAVLDWFGSALAGAIEPPARMTQQVVAGLGASSDATVFLTGRSSAAGAALANGVASHILELDDVHKGSTLHGGAPVISAALAVAEREHATGEDFLLAVAVGYEAALRIGEAVNPSHYRYWHPTGTAATFGAAAAAGSLVGLTAIQMLDALGTAGTQAAGLWEFNADGAMSKPLHAGKAAFNGILAADLAAAGFTGATRILEGARGFFRATAASYDATRITDGLGTHWKIRENCYKMHSCCAHTHTAVDVALAERVGQGWVGREAVDQIESIAIQTYGPGFEIVRAPNPSTPSQAQFSIAYCVAAALLEGHVGLDQFTPDRFESAGVRHADIAALLARTTVTVDDALTVKYPGAWASRVRITLRGTTAGASRGAPTIIETQADYPRGNPENPVSTPDLESKFRALVGARFGTPRAHSALAALHAIPECADMATLLRDHAPWTASVAS